MFCRNGNRNCSILNRRLARASAVGRPFLWLSLFLSVPSHAAECTFPDNVDWVVDASCEVSNIRIAPQDLSVVNGATLTVESSGEIIHDMRNFRIAVDSSSRLRIESGGRVRSNQIGPLLVRQSDGGSFGYFLKRVGGPVLDTINPDLRFHPSSTIKVLYMIEALRQVDNGALNLNTTNLVSCPTTLTPGGAQTCPNSFASATSGGAGGNCGQNAALAANSLATCGAATQSYALGLGICGMMKVSNNAAANAIQETVGAGSPLTGWNNMINGGTTIGLGATSLFSRMGCNGPFSNNPINLTTLRDLGLIYEQMATDPAVLFPTTLPAAVNFATTNAYNFMDNHVNELNANNFVQAITLEQASEAGVIAATANTFLGNVRLVHKTGSNTGSTLYRSAAGWISLPINGGSDTRDYVYGVFVNNVIASDLVAAGATDPAMPQVSIAGGSMLDEAGELLRPVIRDALENF